MDAGENSVLTYSLASPSENFEIKPETGEVVALTQLDAEKLLEPEILEIVARDNGQPSLVGTTTLRISIKDFNDNAPMFIKKDYEFNIIENLPLSFIIGQVEAIDGDINTDLKYQIIQTYSFFPFDIDSETGKIFVNSKLDYEAEYQDYIFQVQAIDSDGFNDLANVTIHILDENDNAPKVKFPHPAKDIVWLNPSSAVIGQLVCQVITLDPDSGANGIVNYEIEGGSGSELVNVNQKGELILQKELNENDQGKFSVFLRITDQGEVQKYTTTRINLYIATEKYSEEELPSLLRQYREELALPSVAGVSQLALLLVAAFSALVFILLLFTVCLYCRFSKKRDKDDHHDIYQEQITTVNQMGTPHNRQETDLKMAQWSELKQQQMMASHQNQSERSFNSGQSASGSCTRDSGAGDSVESEYDTLDGPINDHNQPLIYHVTKFSPTPEYSPTLTYSQRNSAHLIPRKPTFTTFMGDSDTDSVQIVDYTKVNV